MLRKRVGWSWVLSGVIAFCAASAGMADPVSAEDNHNLWSQGAAGYSHSLGIKQDGSVWSWGSNSHGQIGNGAEGSELTELNPVEVTGMTNAVSVGAGKYFSLAVKQDGTVWAWGDNSYGQLGDGAITFRDDATSQISLNANQATPVQVKGISDAVSVYSSFSKSYVVRKDGTVWSIGGPSTYKQTPETFNYSLLAPTQVQGLEQVSQVMMGWTSNLAIRKDGSLVVWGYNDYGEKGDGTVGEAFGPTAVKGFEKVISASGAPNLIMAVKSDGTVWAWGNLLHVQDAAISHPTRIEGLTDVKAVEAGYNIHYILKNDGTVWQWDKFQVTAAGEQQWKVQADLEQVAGLSNVESLSAGGGWSHVIALDKNGHAWAWGDNSTGQLGNNSTAYSAQPVMVGGDGLEAEDAGEAEEETPAVEPEASVEEIVSDPNAIIVTLNGTVLNFEQPPVLIHDKTMVPLRAIFEALGAVIEWDPDTRTVMATRADQAVKLTIGDDVGYVGGRPVKLEQPAVIVNNSTLVPVRFIAESFGADVGWDADSRTVLIKSK